MDRGDAKDVCVCRIGLRWWSRRVDSNQLNQSNGNNDLCKRTESLSKYPEMILNVARCVRSIWTKNYVYTAKILAEAGFYSNR
jgi:hypothetical protein